MVKRIIEGDKSYLTEEESKVIDKSFEAIETYFDRITFVTTKIENGFVVDEIPFTLPKEALTHITVDLSTAYDEFWVTLKEPVIKQCVDGEPVYRNEINIEVVRDEIAEMNDRDFGVGYEDDYKVGDINSYYDYVGEVDGTKFYYREL